MSIPKNARVAGVERTPHDPDTRLLTLEPSEPLDFVGGQYVIVDSGLVLANGKNVKRAYSIVSPDVDQGRFVLAVKRLPDGPGSAYLHALEVGDEVKFSGPWGKLHTGVPTASGAGSAADPKLVVLSTDTGVTAGLGLISGQRFAPHLASTTFIWLSVAADDFLGEAWVRARLPAGLGQARFERISPVGTPERIDRARAALEAALGEGSRAQAFVAGDGAVNYALLDLLTARGVDATRDHVESFFNMPKKAPSAQVAV